MKIFLTALLSLAPLLASAQFPLSIRTTNGTSFNQTINGATNAGNTRFNGPQTGPHAGVSNNQQFVQLGLSNSYFQSAVILPSNVVFNAQSNLTGGSGTFGFIKYVPGTKIVTNTNGVFSRLKSGDNFVWRSDNSQVAVTRVLNANAAEISHAPLNAGATYDGVNWDFYPNAVDIKDINGLHVGWVGNDASYGIKMNGNSGVYYAVSDNQTFFWGPKTSVGGGLVLYASPTNIAQIPGILGIDNQSGNFYESLWCLDGGVWYWKWGVTNPPGDPATAFKGNPDFQKGFQVRSNTLANIPVAPTANGACYFWNSNGFLYLIVSTNGAGGGSGVWTSTNALFR